MVVVNIIYGKLKLIQIVSQETLLALAQYDTNCGHIIWSKDGESSRYPMRYCTVIL